MLVCMFPLTASAASQVNIFNITVTEPKAGEKPSSEGSVPATASTTVTKVKWQGKLADDGTFIAGQSYTVRVTCTIKPNQDKYIKFVASTSKINGNLASFVSLSDDKKSIVLEYKFYIPQKKSDTTTPKPNTSEGSKNESDTTQADVSSDKLLTEEYSELSVNDYEWEVLRRVNIERVKEGLIALTMPQALQKACDVRENELLTLFSHDRPDGTSCFTAISSNFKSRAQGENIAKGQNDPAAVMSSWLNSPGHYANIMSKDFGYMGVGYNANGKAWVQMFASRKDIVKVEPSTTQTKFTESEIQNHYLKITTSDGYVSYLPLDFSSMKMLDIGIYVPNISAPTLPKYTKVAGTGSNPAAGNNQSSSTQTPAKDSGKSHSDVAVTDEIVKVNISDIDVSEYEWNVLRYTNIERAKRGLYLFSMPQVLQKAANQRGADLEKKYANVRPDGSNAMSVIDPLFKYSQSCENIGQGNFTPAQVVDGWMNNQSQASNITNQYLGLLGVEYNPNGNYWSQVFTDRKEILKVEASTGKTAFSASEIKNHYLRLTTADGYVSYLPLDFASMMKNPDGTYSPYLPIEGIPSYILLPEGTPGSGGNDGFTVIVANKGLTENAEIIKNAVENSVDQNYFNKTGLLNVAHAAIKYITTVEWVQYNEVPATVSTEGLITGTFKLTFLDETMTFDIRKVIPKLPDTGNADSVFERYIPIDHVYGASLYTLWKIKPGDDYTFQFGTQFADESNPAVFFSPVIKRCEYPGAYVRLSYLGTYGTVGDKLGNKHLNILSSNDYNELLKGNASQNAQEWGLSKDTIVISVDLYDANKRFVRNISPACVIIVTGTNGDFLTYSRFGGRNCSLYFTEQANLFAPSEDQPMSSQSLNFKVDKVMTTDKSAIEYFLSPQRAEEANKPYEFIQYPALTGTPNYNANKILTDEEFITPDNTYYQVTRDDEIDPEVMNKIENVKSYSEYRHIISAGYTQRNIVAGDGTLYGITTKDEKIEIAKNVKKTAAYHYLTEDGVLKELSGRVVTTNCVDFAESYDFRILGVLKNDGCLYLGYSYYAGGEDYKKGITKKLENVTHVVPAGCYTQNKTFYRWNETITPGGMDEQAWSRGEFKPIDICELDVVKVCSDVDRVFPYEYLTKIWVPSSMMDHNITSFVQTKDNELIGYGIKYHQSFGIFEGKVERIFPMYKSHDEGNFVGIKLENDTYVYGICCRVCDNNQYRKGMIGTPGKKEECCPQFVAETLDGFLARDGKVYSIDPHIGKIVVDYRIEPEENDRINLGQMNRSKGVFSALNSTTMESIPLLPSVANWCFDEHQIILLEREDGSMWASSFLPKESAANFSAKLGGYENSNAIQISPATTKKVSTDTEYLTFDKMPTFTPQTKPSFADVASDAWYAEPVNWAVDKGITTGTSATTFSPDNTCTRAQILTFMYRAAGAPGMTIANPFTDVKETDYFYGAALWAYSKGMVTGNVFAGDTPCTRSATVVYLWQNAGSPWAMYGGFFDDVPKEASYGSAVAWAMANGVTSGTSATTFSPDTTCTRGQIVTFLMRAFK